MFASNGNSLGCKKIYRAFQLMHRFNVLDTVLPVESLIAAFPAVDSSHSTIVDRWQDIALLSMSTIVRLTDDGDPFGAANVKDLMWAASLCGLSGIKVLEKNKHISLTTIVLREGLKMETNSIRNIQTMMDCMAEFCSFQSGIVKLSRENAGMVLRTCKDLWRDCILLAAAYSLALPGVDSSKVSNIIAGFGEMLKEIEKMGLDGIWNMKPLLNGSELIRILGLPKGPAVGLLMEEQTRWQLRECSEDVNALCEYLKEKAPELVGVVEGQQGLEKGSKKLKKSKS
mmetsp:Transcript_22244/g.31951  ORF Transcript_22244/g.31951 Transcript_22244/m.31951 type:complete len:285 (+) Transcript_22244:218-1072(+)